MFHSANQDSIDNEILNQFTVVKTANSIDFEVTETTDTSISKNDDEQVKTLLSRGVSPSHPVSALLLNRHYLFKARLYFNKNSIYITN